MVDGINTYLSTLMKIGEKEADLYIETGKQPYQGIFSQFNGKPAYQFTLDETKFQGILEEAVAAVNQLNQQM